jgi:hypothetical protein
VYRVIPASEESEGLGASRENEVSVAWLASQVEIGRRHGVHLVNLVRVADLD